MKLKTRQLLNIYNLNVGDILINTRKNKMYQIRWFNEKTIQLELLLASNKDMYVLAQIDILEQEVTQSDWVVVLEVEGDNV